MARNRDAGRLKFNRIASSARISASVWRRPGRSTRPLLEAGRGGRVRSARLWVRNPAASDSGRAASAEFCLPEGVPERQDSTYTGRCDRGGGRPSFGERRRLRSTVLVRHFD
jgi:hypothetical protein